MTRKSIEYLALGAVAFLLSGALEVLLASGNMASDGDRRYEAMLALLYFAVAAIGLMHFGLARYATLHTPALLGLLILAFASAAWSEAPGLVLRRSIGLAGASFFGIVFGSLLTVSEQVSVLRWVFRLAAALSLAMVIVSPAHGISSSMEAGAWRGVFIHKNGLGGVMALAVLVEWLHPTSAVLSKILKAAWLGLYGVLLLKSNSITAALAIVLALALLYVVRICHGQYRIPLPAVIATAAFVGAFLYEGKASITTALGRSSDITGRTELWHWVVAMILSRPWLGYGFSGFWRGGSSEYASVERAIGWSPIYSHNGYLEITLSLGVAGLLLFVWMAVVGLRRAFDQAQHGESAASYWPLAFLLYFLVHNLGECTILWQNSLEWALCVSVVVCADPVLRAAWRTEDVPQAEVAVASTQEYA
ncbi:MAG TPA: O-antigen ligase family protein [Bryobacteraceae bacterium]|nr:O-antigen ligase family protein [Bryobacteraceae bacterium]